MIRTLRIVGLGPHEDTTIELDPAGKNTIAGPSESGKTTALDALCWVLWGTSASGKGLRKELVRGDTCEVTAVLASGTKLRRRATLKTMSRFRGEEAVETELSWLAQLRGLGKNPDLLRVILAPLAWVPLAEGAGGGRPLRDLLASVVPGSLREIVAELAGADLLETDSHVESEIYERRREQNRQVDELRGKLGASDDEVRRLAGSHVEQPTPQEVQSAKVVLESDAMWTRYENQPILGERPDDTAWKETNLKRIAAKEEAENKFRDLRAQVSEADRQHREFKIESPELQAIRATVRTQIALVDSLANAGEACRECGQPIPDAKARRKAAAARLEELLAEEQAVVAKVDKEHDAGKKEKLRVLDYAKGELQMAGVALEKARKSLTNLGPNPAAEWDAQNKLPRVEKPKSARPYEEVVATARKVLARLEQSRGAVKAQDEARKRAVAAKEQVQKSYDTAVIESTRLDRLLEAVRKAPSVLAERQIERFGDMGPVSLEFGDKGGVEVQIDGRPWWAASRGRQIVGDLHFRAALRRAVKLSWLPIWVDNVGDWSGDWPDIEAPVVMLQTTKEPWSVS